MDEQKDMWEQIRERNQNEAYVRNLILDEYRHTLDDDSDQEPQVSFTVKIPVSDLGKMERIGSYLGHKKTPFASMLLQAAIEDAWWGLLVAAEDAGKRDEVAAYLQEPHELEGGIGQTQIKGGV